MVDTDPMNPREWHENAGRIICWHSRYNLGDEHSYSCLSDFMRELAFETCTGLEDKVNNLEDNVYSKLYDRAVNAGNDDPHGYADRLVSPRITEYIDSIVRDGYVILPLYLMDHSGISMGTCSFGCMWDSGQVGWIICDNATIEKEFNGDRDLAEEVLQAEVKSYDQYIRGDIYGFIVEETDDPDSDDWEHVDSCWGFYGSDIHENGMADHLGSDELIALAESADVTY